MEPNQRLVAKIHDGRLYPNGYDVKSMHFFNDYPLKSAGVDAAIYNGIPVPEGGRR